MIQATYMLAKLCTNRLRPDSATRRMSNGSCSPFDVSLCGTSELKDLMTVRVTESMATNLIAVVPTSAGNGNASESVDGDMHRAAVKQTKERCTYRCQPQPLDEEIYHNSLQFASRRWQVLRQGLVLT